MTYAIDPSLALLKAARSGDADGVRRLFAAGADANARDVFSGYTALHAAAGGGHRAVVRVLIEAGADVADRRNTVFQSALASAATAGRLDVVAYLLDHGADPAEVLHPDDTPLVEECEREGPPEVAALLRRARENKRSRQR